MNQEPNNLVMQALTPGADSVRLSGADSVRLSGADSVRLSGADSVRLSGADSVNPSVTHGFASFGAHSLKVLINLREKHQITNTFPRGKLKNLSGADSVRLSGADSVNPSVTHGFASFGAHSLKVLINLREKHQITNTFPRGKLKNLSGADSVRLSGADSVNPSVTNGFTSFGADSLKVLINLREKHQITNTLPRGKLKNLSGADSVRLSGADSVRLSGADSVRLSGADSVRLSGADSVKNHPSNPFYSRVFAIGNTVMFFLNTLVLNTIANPVENSKSKAPLSTYFFWNLAR